MSMWFREHDIPLIKRRVHIEYGRAAKLGDMPSVKLSNARNGYCWYYDKPRLLREPPIFTRWGVTLLWLCFYVSVVVMPRWGRR